ncbi:hypothetical protein Hanom_Chr15g01389151 [Helianthus anomalus]
MPYSTEELINEDTMTYCPKTSKSSINSRSINESGTSKINFVSKGTFDPNSSFACADEVEDLKCEVSLGGEQAFVSDFSKTSFDKTDSGCVFGQVFLDSFHAYVSSSGPMFWEKLIMFVRSLRIHSVIPLKPLLKKIKNVLILLLIWSQWTSLMVNLVGPHWKPSLKANLK